MGQAKRESVGPCLPLPTDDSDLPDTDTFATHRIPIDEAPQACEMFQKEDGAIKVVIQP